MTSIRSWRRGMETRLGLPLLLIARLIYGDNFALALGGKPRSVNSARAILPQAFTSLAGQSSTLLPDGRLLLLGGEGSAGLLASAVILDGRSGAATSVAGRLEQPRAWHTATLLPDGTVLILGGVGADGKALETLEVFDPEQQKFERLLSAGLTPRAYHTATLLTDGRVLIAGGVSQKGETLAGVELWDPKTASAVNSPALLQTPRRRHTAMLLASGSVLLVRGEDAAGSALESPELYDPKADRFRSEDALPGPLESSAPRLEASLPEDGATDVPVDTLIALRFSKPLRVETVNFGSVTLAGAAGTVPLKVIPAEGGLLAFLTPRKALLPNTRYALSLAGPRDSLNRSLSPAALSFTTAGEQVPPIPVPDSEEWTPDTGNLQGDWRSLRPDSSWRSLPPLKAEDGVTALAGQVLTLSSRPLARVKLELEGRATQSDETGRFLLAALSAGHRVLKVDGREASRPGKTYGIFKIGVDLADRRTTILPYTIWMPQLDTAHAVTFSSPAASEVSVTTPRIPGLEVRIPAGAVVRDTEGQTVTQLSITAIPVDRTPFPLPGGVTVPVFFTVQPGASYVLPPRARIIYPNYTSQPAGARLNFWNYDPDGKGWYVYGQGTVTPDRKQVIPDPGVVIYEFTGAMINDPDYTPPISGTAPEELEKGDPVDPATGLFVLDKTDLFLPDVMPLTLTRTYRPGDTISRPFGIGATHSFDLRLWSAREYQEADLVLPSGTRIHYVRISPGTGFADAVFEHTTTATRFHKSRMHWNGEGWDLTLKDGTVYVFGDISPLQAIRDRYGNQITISRARINRMRSPTGNITRITSPNNRWIEFAYDSSNRITQARDNAGRIVRYEYDAAGRLWKVTDPRNGVTEHLYDASHRMLTIQDARNIVYLTNEYDANGRVIRQIQADTTTFRFDYTDSGGRITQTDVTDPRGNVTRITFNADGYSLSETRALGTPEQQTYVYERQAGTNLLLSVTDPLNRRTAYTYDPRGNVTGITRLAGTADAVTTTFSYEPAFNQLASVLDPLTHRWLLDYDGRGNLTAVTDPINHRGTFEYSTAGQPTSASDHLGNRIQFGYDGGDLASVTNPLGHTRSRFFDGAGRLLALVNPLGHMTRYEYDALNQLRRVTDALQGLTRFDYDPNGNLLTVTDARNNATGYTPSNMDRLERRRDPLLRDQTYRYDPNGNLRRLTDRKGQATTFRYDGLNRLTFVGFGTVGEGEGETYESTIRYTYDAGNRLREVVDSVSGTISLDYDNLDRLTRETTPEGTVNYTYDRSGRRESMTASGQTRLDYEFDDADRMRFVRQGASTVRIDYDDVNRPTSVTLPNGIVMEYDYDRASQLIGITYRLGAAVLGNLTYEYDDAGNRIRMGGSWARTGLPEDMTSATYDAANRLTQWGGMNLGYDTNGNLSSDGLNTYSWSSRNQPTSITGGVSASFQYDAFGRRRSKTVGGVTGQFLYDGLNPVQELSAGTPTANLLTGLSLDEIFARTDLDGPRWLLTDALGSALTLADSSGSVLTQYTYEPFGKTTFSGPVNANPFQYTGRENDGTGLYYYRARYYSPTLQRFVSEDPVGLAGGINLYSYVGNNPCRFLDPLGLDKKKQCDPWWYRWADSFDLTVGWIIGSEEATFLRREYGREIATFSREFTRQVGMLFGTPTWEEARRYNLRYPIWRPRPMPWPWGPPYFGRAETVILAGATHAGAAALGVGAFTTGILIGSAINVTFIDTCRVRMR